MFTRRIVAFFFLAAIAFLTLAFVATPTGEVASSKLMDGNKRFVSGTLAQKQACDVRRKELTAGQQPFAIVVTCSDSRLAPEIIFDQGLGDIFVVRVAGNVLDPIALGSIEYAAEHLHAHLLILMGHEKCGAVSASMDATGEPEGNIGAIVKKILPSVKKAKAKGGTNDEMLLNAIKENVSDSYATILKQSPVLKHLISAGELKVIAGLYHLGSGEVEMLNIAAAPAAGTHSHK